MKAVKINASSGKLHWGDYSKPSIGNAEVLIRVMATAVNRADLLQRQGKYPVPKGASNIIGLEAAGIIEEVAPSCGNHKVGDRVFCLLAGGSYAQYVAAPVSLLMPIPNNLSFEQAASIPEAFLTAYLNLFLEGKLKSGETLLIHAAASGVGIAALQLARESGVKVFATAGSDAKCDFIRSLGAIDCINYKQVDFLEKIGEKSIDLVLDMVGQKHFTKNLAVLNYRGRLVMLSLISGAKAEIDLSALLRKNLCIKGSTLRDRSLEEKAELTRSFAKNILPLFEKGSISPIICKSYPIEDVEEAHKFVAEDLNLGKVVLTLECEEKKDEKTLNLINKY